MLGLLFGLGLLGELLGGLGVLCELGVGGTGMEGMGGGGKVRWLHATKKRRLPRKQKLRVGNEFSFIVGSVLVKNSAY